MKTTLHRLLHLKFPLTALVAALVVMIGSVEVCQAKGRSPRPSGQGQSGWIRSTYKDGYAVSQYLTKQRIYHEMQPYNSGKGHKVKDSGLPPHMAPVMHPVSTVHPRYVAPKRNGHGRPTTSSYSSQYAATAGCPAYR